MSDQEFEKRVRQKMDELNLHPSEHVWKNVEHEIQKKDRRRRLLWIPFFAALLIAGAYFVYPWLRATDPKNSQSPSVISEKPESIKPNTSIEKDNTEVTVNEKKSTKPGVSEQKSAKRSDELNRSDEPNNKMVNSDQVKPSIITDESKNSNSKKLKVEQQSRIIVQKDVLIVKQHERGEHQQKNISPKNISNDNTPVEKLATVQAKSTVSTDEQVEGRRVSVKTENVTDLRTVFPTQISGSSTIPVNETNKFITSNPENIESRNSSVASENIEKKSKNKSNWQWGITASIGQAGIAEGSFFDLQKSEAFDLAGNFSSGSTARQKPSVVDGGLQYAFGVIARKNVSRRIALSAGLRYKAFKTHITTGEQVDSNKMISNPTSGQLQLSTFYRPGETYNYTNHYRFLELPVAAHIQLTKRLKVPIFWDIQFSIARLISSDALQFDGANGIYYSDNSSLNKTLYNIGSGFSVGLFARSKHPLYIGPSFQYSINSLFASPVPDKKHLRSFNLDLKFLIKK